MAVTKDSINAAGPDAANKTTGAAQSFWTPGRVLLSVVGIGLIVTIGWSRWNSKDVPVNNAPVRPVVNAPVTTAPPLLPVMVPADLRETKLQTLDGESLKLSDFADKVLIVNLWATWCGPCRQEMPELVKISKEYKERGLVVLGLATSYNERNDPTHVKDYIRSQNVPYQIIWDDGTLAGPLVEMVQGRAVIPQSFVIGRDGRIVKHFTGFRPSMDPQLMRQAVEDALNDKGKA